MGRSLEQSNQQTQLAHQVLDLSAFRNSFAGVDSILECVFVAAGGARPRSTTMHTTTFFALDRRRSAGRTGPRLRPATWAGQHRPGVTLVISRHTYFGLYRVTPAARFLLLPTFGIGAVVASDIMGGETAGVSGALSRCACVRLPTTAAWPPS